MQEQEAVLLRVYLAEGERYQNKSSYEYVLERANVAGMAGVTVLRGILGYGKKHHLHSAKVLRLSENLPLVIEIVDSCEKIQGFLPVLQECLPGALITQEKVQILKPLS
ncbi:MAG TPA: DUF190 domain-containing protein [Candidatus Bathyarchaeia archaeon]|nr:DUF190 domain-containing protein [Candidatus Bathyarchaeia archaeon]